MSIHHQYIYIILGLCIFLIVSQLPTVSTALGFCYFQLDGNLDPDAIDPFLCTHIIVFPVRSSQTAVINKDLYSIHDTAPLRNAIQRLVAIKAKNQQLKVLISLFDKDDNWMDYSRTAVATSCQKFIQRHKLDGLDIFYNGEAATSSTCINMIALLNTLKSLLGQRKTLIICIRSDKVGCDVNEWVDFVLVRAFLLNRESDRTGHDSALISTHNKLNPYNDIMKVTDFMQNKMKISRDKLVIGFPLFSSPQTRVATADTGVGSATIGRKINQLPSFIKQTGVKYPDLCVQYNGGKYIWDDEQRASYISDGLKWLSFDSKRGICYKTSWLKKNELNAGYILWTLDMDDHNETCGDGRFPVATYLKENYGKTHTDEECKDEIPWTVPSYCEKEQSDKFPGYTYNRSFQGTIITINCDKGSVIRKCIWEFDKAHWDVEIDDCKTVSQIVDDARLLLGELEEATSHYTRSLVPAEVQRVVQCVEDLSKFANKNETIPELTLSLIATLMKPNTNTWTIADGKSGATVVDILERIAAKLNVPYGMTNTSIITESIFVAVYNISALTKDETLTVHCKFMKETANEELAMPTATIYPNSEYFKQQRIRRIEVLAYKNSKLFASPESTRVRNNYSVVSINPGGGMVYKRNAVVAKYIIPQPVNDSNNYTCVFWDRLTQNWSTVGVILREDGKNKTCVTNHLSSFSILLVAKTDEPIPEVHGISLTYISYIGCGVSILGLLLTIITFGLFKSLHREKSGKILLNLCVAMLLLNVAFFALDDLKTRSIEACMAEAIALHFFLLATLMWMMIEALHMYENLIVVFVESRRWFMRFRMIFGWGLPTIVAGFTGVYTKDQFKESNEQCFLSLINPDVFYCVVLAPACLIILVNTFVFIRVSAIILKHTATVRDPSKANVTKLASVVSLTQVRGAMSVMFVLGLTWVFGPLAIGPQKIVFLYLFAIFNSIQGFLVFMFRCAFNREARLAWKYYLTTGKIKQRRGSIASSTRWASDRSVHSRTSHTSLRAHNVKTMSMGKIASGQMASIKKRPESKGSINITSMGQTFLG